jgi:hypothetical protein
LHTNIKHVSFQISELEELTRIELAVQKQFENSSTPLTLSTPEAKAAFIPGNICVARFWGDAKWYRARILAILTHDKVPHPVCIINCNLNLYLYIIDLIFSFSC